MRRLRFLLAMAFMASLTATGLLSAGAATAVAAPAVAAQATCSTDWPTSNLQIMAPAGPGGGWDTTAREIQRVLQEQKLVNKSVEVFNVPGAAGTVGLAELTSKDKGDENMMMVMGLVMVGGIELNASPVGLDQVTPIARLTTEYEVVVVPKDSPYQTLDDLIQAFKKDPGSVSWGGGSAGGTDHILAGLIAKDAGVDPTKVNYVAFSGGGEALAAILGGQVTAGISGLSEWESQIESGDLRALAISGRAEASGGNATPAASGESAAGSDIKTLKEQGVNVELANWRGIVAPPGISDDAKNCMTATMDKLSTSPGWQEALAKNGWTGFYLSGDDYASYLQTEEQKTKEILTDLGLI